ncbi:MAG: hypothetical protein U0163_07255 [Gemmatimonadaceae bacterium]
MRNIELPARSERLADIINRVGLATLRRSVVNALAPLALRRVALAEALAVDARVLLLDETATGLCPSAADQFGALLRHIASDGRGVLVVSRERGVLPHLSSRRFTLLGGVLLGGDLPGTLWTGQDSRMTINDRRRMP